MALNQTPTSWSPSVPPTDISNTDNTYRLAVYGACAALLGFAAYLCYVLIAKSTGPALASDIATSNRPVKTVNSKTYKDLSSQEFYKLQGMSMNDVLRVRLRESSVENGISTTNDAKFARDVIIKRNPQLLSIDENNDVYTSYDQNAAKKEYDAEYRGRIPSIEEIAKAEKASAIAAKVLADANASAKLQADKKAAQLAAAREAAALKSRAEATSRGVL